MKSGKETMLKRKRYKQHRRLF